MTSQIYSIMLFAISAVLAGATVFFTIISKQKREKRFSVISKVLSLTFALCYFIRLFSVDDFYKVDNLLSPFLSRQNVIMLTVLRALTMLAVVCISTAPFFKRRHLDNIVAFFVPVIYIINIMQFSANVSAFVGVEGLLNFPTGSFREIQFAVECVLGLTIGALYLTKKIVNKDWKQPLAQAWQMVVATVILTLLSMPNSTYFNLFGEVGNTTDGFSAEHVSLLVATLVVGVALFLLLRHREMRDKDYVLTMGAILLWIQFFCYYNYFVWPIDVNNIPLHLCHAASILLPICFIFKIKKIFYFNYFVNVIGAIFALLVVESDLYLTSELGFHYWFEHICITLLPILAVALNVFERPNMKSIGYCFAVFTGYFVITGFLNAFLNNFGEVNYFFMNGDSLVNRFDFLRNIIPGVTIDLPAFKNGLVWVVNMGKYQLTIYWAYWLLMYVGYVILVLLQWLIYYAFYKIADDHWNLHTIKKRKKEEMANLEKLLKEKKEVLPLYPDKKGIYISHFSKVYSGSQNRSVDDFSLEIQPGTVYGFLGHNGAGKSTTIKSLVGIQTITEGTMAVCGFDIAKQSLEAKLNIGYVSDNHAVYEQLTGREYINYVADLYLVGQKERQERFDKYVSMFNLTDAIDREIKGYSHGMKQKIVVIASLMHDPKVWILDEPLTGLDPSSSFQIKECMRDHANRGNVVFFSSHVIEVVEKICDKICIIGKGKLVGEWTLSQLDKDNTTLEQLYMKHVSQYNLNTQQEKTGEKE